MSIMYPTSYILTDNTPVFPLLNHRYKIFGVTVPTAKFNKLKLLFKFSIRHENLLGVSSTPKLEVFIDCDDDVLCQILHVSQCFAFN